MSTPGSRTPGREATGSNVTNPSHRRVSTETKAAPKTTEFVLTVAAIIGVLIAAAVINGGDTHGTDEFIARQAWLYIAIIVGAYSIGRGLAKSGSREPYDDDNNR